MSKNDRHLATIATVREKRQLAVNDVTNAQIRVRAFDEFLELLEHEETAEPEKPPVQRAPRGSVQAAVLEALQIGGGHPWSVDDLEKSLLGASRSSIRKALAALQKAGKIDERHDGSWAIKLAPDFRVPTRGVGPVEMPIDDRIGTNQVVHHAETFDPNTGELRALDDASVRED